MRRLKLESLEHRIPLAADLAITDAFLVDRMNNPISAPVEGELAFVRAEWNTTDLNSSQQYVVRFEMDGITVASNTLNGQSGTNLSFQWYRGVAYSAPGIRSVRVVVDGGGQIAESNESNNEFAFSFTPAATDFPEKMVFPMGGDRYKDWAVGNYSDVNINSGMRQDFRGGVFQYDGHDAFDIGLANFERMDDGIPIFAAAAGTVINVADGNFDREVSANNRPANYVRIDHGGGWWTNYFHLQRSTVAVEVGQTVSKGQMIGLTGSSGSSTDAHLHFSLYRNGTRVEPMYQPQDYFVEAPIYQLDLPTTITASGITDRAPWDEFKEIPNEIRQFRSDGSQDTWFWYRISHLNDGESLAIQWYRPDGILDATYNWTADGVARHSRHGWVRNTRAHTGTWTVILKHGATELAREMFEVIGSGGSPELDVRDENTYIINGRSTPIDFGAVSVGNTAVTRTFTLSNWGTQNLEITGVDPPSGFQVVTIPAPIAPGNSGSLVVEMTTDRVDTKWGDIVIHTNDLDESRFRFVVEGSVTGTPLADAASLQHDGPALAIENRLPQAVFPTLTIGNVSGLDLAGGTLAANIASGETATDRLLIQSPSIQVIQGQLFFESTHVANVVSDGVDGLFALDLLPIASTTTITEIARSVHFVDVAETPASRRRIIDLHVTDLTGVASNTIRRAAAYSDHLHAATVLTLAISPTTLSENGGTTVATVTRNSSDGDLIVSLLSSDTSEATVPLNIVIPNGQNTSAPVTITGVDDLVADGTQTVTITAMAPGYSEATETVDVIDDDAAALTIEDVSSVEGVGLVFTVALDVAVQSGFTVSTNLADVTATGGSDPLVAPADYDNAAATLTFAGTAGETQQFLVNTRDDGVLEGAETLMVSLDAAAAPVNDSDTAIGTVLDNDSASITVEDATIVEGGELQLTVTLDNSVQGAFDVNINLADITATGGASPLLSPEDFDNASVTLNFAGTAGETQQLTINTRDDVILEGIETFTVNLDATNSLVNDSDTAIGTISDNDSAAVTIEDVSSVEGVGLVFTVTLDVAVADAFDVIASLADITATGGSTPLLAPTDYEHAAMTLSFAGIAGETQQFLVKTRDDRVVEGVETFTVNLDVVSAPVSDSDTAIGTINDNDIAAVTVEDSTVVEGGGLQFGVALDSPVQGGFEVNVSLADISATGGSAPLLIPEDYDNATVTLNFAGIAGETQQFTIDTQDDDVLEGMETLSVHLGVSNTLVNDSDTATGTISDNDAGSVTIEDVTVVEGGELLFTVTLDNSVQVPLDVNVTMVDISATGGSVPLLSPEDYNSAGVTLSFAGNAGETQQFTVATSTDDVIEGDETFTVNLEATNALVNDSDTAMGTINDAPANTTPTITDIGDVSTAINTTTAAITFAVGDVETESGSLEVTAVSSNQTVVPDVNVPIFGSDSNRTITITPTTDQIGIATITVTVTDEGGLTAFETFVLTVSAPSGDPIVHVSPTGANGATDPADLASGPQPTSWPLQRSDMREIVIDLPTPIASASVNDVVLTNLGLDADVDPDATVPLRQDQLQLSTDGLQLRIRPDANQLTHGVYQLDLLSSITGGATFTFTGDADNGFYVLTGDWNGSGGVNIQDFATFAYWFGKSVPTAPDYVDVNGSGGVNIQDFAGFAANFGVSISFPGDAAGFSAGGAGEGELEAAMRSLLNRPDVNFDGRVTAADAMIVVKELVHGASTESAAGSRFDTNRDGMLTSADALVVINALAAQATEPQATLPTNDARPANQSAAMSLEPSLSEPAPRKGKILDATRAAAVDLTMREVILSDDTKRDEMEFASLDEVIELLSSGHV